MTALVTEAREALVAAFTGQGLQVYTTVPAVPRPPAVVIVPDSPWITHERGTALGYRVRWRVLIVISPRNNEAATLDVENAIDLLLPLIPAGFSWDVVNPPQLNDVGAQGTVYTTEINVSVSMKEL
jgi:hypothetical protein